MLLHHDLPSGARVRLRLPVRSDAAGLRELVGAEEAEALLRFDPRRRSVLCATDFEGVAGVGAIDLEPGASPDVLVAGDRHGEALEALIADVLVNRARTVRQPVPRPRLRLWRSRRP
jgi:hypothetical protein